METTTAAAPPQPAGRLLSTRARNGLLTAHLAGGVGLAGVAFVEVAMGVAGLSGAAPETIYPAMALVARTALVPLALVALATGVLQAVLTGYGLFKQWWVTVKLAITVLLAGVATLVAAPGLGRAADAATSATEDVAATQQIVAVATPALALMLLLLNTALGVVKPARRHSG